MEPVWAHGRLPIPSCHLAWFHDYSCYYHANAGLLLLLGPDGSVRGGKIGSGCLILSLRFILEVYLHATRVYPYLQLVSAARELWDG